MLSEVDLKTISYLEKVIDEIKCGYHNIIKDLKFIKIMAIEERKAIILFHEYADDTMYLHYLKTDDASMVNTIIGKGKISLFVDINGNIVKEYLK